MATTERESVEQLAERIESAVNAAAYNNSGCVLLPLGSIAKIVVPMLRNAGTPCAAPLAQDAELPAQETPTPDHRAAERAELERVKKRNDLSDNAFLAVCEERDALQAQLARAKAKLMDTEQAARQLSDVGAALLDDVLHRIVSDFLAKEPQPAAQRGEGRE